MRFRGPLALAVAAFLVSACAHSNSTSVLPASVQHGFKAAGNGTGSASIVQSNSGYGPLGTSVTVTLTSAPTPGDVLVLFLEDDSKVTLSSQTGWTIQDTYTGSSIVGFSVATHVVGSGDGTSYTLTTTSGHYESYALYELANVNTLQPLNFKGHTGYPSGTTTFTTPSGTPSVVGTLPLAAFVGTNDSGTWTLGGQWTKDQYQATFSLESAHGPLTTDTHTPISESATFSQASTYPGVAELVLVNPATSPPAYNGCTVFPATDPVWNTQVTATPDPNSNTYMTAMTSVASTWEVFANHASNYWLINQASSATPTYTLTYNGSTLQGITDMPFESTYTWEAKGLASDHHLMIVSSGNCHVWEGYTGTNETTQGPSWKISGSDVVTTEGYAVEYDLNNPYPTPAPTSANVPGGGGVTDMGPLFPGVVRWEDYQNNTPHALELIVPDAAMLTGTFVYPAKKSCGLPGCAGAANTPPLGTRVVLSSSASLPSCIGAGTCPQTAFVVKALQEYGAYISDGGESGFTIRMGNESNGTDPWSTTDLQNLNTIKINSTNFYFVKPPYCNTTISACEGQNPPSS